MDIVAGTYEQLLLGYRVTQVGEGLDKTYKFTQSFTDHSHIGCVKSLALSSQGVLASGSTDETIQLLDLKRRVEMGSLVHHEGAITDLAFHESSHLFSVSEDACVSIWKYQTWECLRTLKGHKGAITSLSVHPSGKLALTVARDKTLRTWNLVTGRPAYITNTPLVGECVRWSPKGGYYAILYERSIDVYDTATAAVCCKIEAKPAINSMVFCEDATLAYSVEGGLILLHHVASDKQLHTINNDTKRVKSMVCGWCPDDVTLTWLVAASSNGVIKIWQLDFNDTKNSRVVAEVSSGFRIVSLAAMSHTLDVTTHPPPARGSSSSSEGEGVEMDGDSDWSDKDEVINVQKPSVVAQPPAAEAISVESTETLKSASGKKVEQSSNNVKTRKTVKRKGSAVNTKAVLNTASKRTFKCNATTTFSVTKIKCKKSN